MLGSELAGRIADSSPIPDGCPFRRGDRVFGAAQGAFGEQVAAAWQSLVPLPDNMSYDQGAGESLCFVVACWMRGLQGSAVVRGDGRSWGGCTDVAFRSVRDLADEL